MFRYLLLCLVFLPGYLLAQNSKVVKTSQTTFSNGFTVIVREDHRFPVFVSQIWYRVGSADEQYGMTGLSHMLEHMMFRGTKTIKNGAFSKMIAAKGGTENAYTMRDATVYFQTLASGNLETVLKLEADRMQHLEISDTAFKHELEVVKEERRMRVIDNPNGLTYERFMTQAHLASPYHNPISGWMDDLKHLRPEDARNWYKTWYAPNNATLLVIGDVQTKRVIQIAKKYFGRIPKSQLPPEKPKRETPRLGKRKIIVRASAQVPLLLMGFNVPNLNTAIDKQDAYTLSLIASILDENDNSRLSKHLIRGQQIATAIDTGYGMYDRFDTLFYFYAVPSKDHSIEALTTALRKELTQLQTTLVTADELQLIKTQVLANKIYARDSLFSQAMQMGQFHLIGLKWDEADNFIRQISQITPEQIQAVAKKYFTDDRLTIAILNPQKQGAKA